MSSRNEYTAGDLAVQMTMYALGLKQKIKLALDSVEISEGARDLMRERNSLIRSTGSNIGSLVFTVKREPGSPLTSRQENKIQRAIANLENYEDNVFPEILSEFEGKCSSRKVSEKSTSEETPPKPEILKKKSSFDYSLPKKNNEKRTLDTMYSAVYMDLKRNKYVPKLDRKDKEMLVKGLKLCFSENEDEFIIEMTVEGPVAKDDFDAINEIIEEVGFD